MTHTECCPVCGGNGLVQQGFYLSVTGHFASNTTQFEQCRTCLGQGYVVVTDQEKRQWFVPPPPEFVP